MSILKKTIIPTKVLKEENEKVMKEKKLKEKLTREFILRIQQELLYKSYVNN
nr:MAG TPA: hypothetical protein [Caudoviricetes sp.]